MRGTTDGGSWEWTGGTIGIGVFSREIGKRFPFPYFKIFGKTPEKRRNETSVFASDSHRHLQTNGKRDEWMRKNRGSQGPFWSALG